MSSTDHIWIKIHVVLIVKDWFVTFSLLIIYKVVENELADNKYSEYLMKLFKNRDLQSKKDKRSDDNTVSKTDTGNYCNFIGYNILTYFTLLNY